MLSVLIVLGLLSCGGASDVTVSLHAQALPGTDFAVSLGRYEGEVVTGPEASVPYVYRAQRPGCVAQIKALNSMNVTTMNLRGSEYYLVFLPSDAAVQVKVDSIAHLCDKEIVMAPHAVISGPVHMRTTAKKSEKEHLMNRIHGEEFLRELELLSGAEPLHDGTRLVTRFSYHEMVERAADHVLEYFGEHGFDTREGTSNPHRAYKQRFNLNSYDLCNVVAVKPGQAVLRGDAEEIVIIGAHYDSISPTPNLAPGAVDNGSGSVGSMLAAKIFGHNDVTFEHTVHFIVFGGEEQGLHGSTFYVNEAQRQGWNIRNVIIMDMISYSNRHFGVTIEGTRNAAIVNLMDLMEDNTREFGEALTINRNYNSFGSDHVPFQRAGIPAILLIEQDDTNYPCYHRECDTVEYVNKDQSEAIVRAACAGLFDIAEGVL